MREASTFLNARWGADEHVRARLEPHEYLTITAECDEQDRIVLISWALENHWGQIAHSAIWAYQSGGAS